MLILESEPSWHFWVDALVPILTAFVTILVAVLGFRHTAKLQRDAESAQQAAEASRAKEIIDERRTLDRVSLFGELARVHKVAAGQLRYVDSDKLRFIWVPVFETLLPSQTNRKRIELLTMEEVKALTSFFFSYQEHVSYIAASGDRNLARQTGLPIDAIGYDYSSGERLAGLNGPWEQLKDVLTRPSRRLASISARSPRLASSRRRRGPT